MEEVRDVVVLEEKSLTNSIENVNQRKEIIKYWDKETINYKIDQIKNYKHKMLMKYLWMSGVRITEAINLTKKDLDFNNYTMALKWLKSRKYYTRIAPIHPNLRDILQLYVSTMNLEDKVFPFTRQRAWQLVKKYMGGHPHQFRHSFAVNWLRQGGDVVILSRILGHSKITTTMEYLKVVPVDQGRELIKIQF